MFSDFFAILHYYLSWFSSTNLLFWASSKNRFGFERNQKSLILFSTLPLSKNFFLIVTTFRYKTALHAWSSKNILSFVCVFKLFSKIPSLSLSFCSKKKHLKSNWFSLLFLFTSSSCFVLSLCVFSLCLLSSLLLKTIFAKKKKNLKNGLPVSHFFTILLWRAEKKKRSFLSNKLERTSYHSPSQKFPREIFLFSSFSILFHSIQAFFFCEQRDFLFVSSRFYFPKKIFRFFFLKKKKTNLSWKKFFLSSNVSCIFFASLFVFVHHVSHSPLFFVSVFCSIILFPWCPSSWTQFSCTSLSIFFEQQFLLQVVSEKIQIFTFYMHGLPLNVLFCSHTSPHQKKKLFVHFPFGCAPFHIYLFLHVCRFFFDFSLFYSRVLKHFSFLFSFLNVVLCWSLFMYLSFFFENSVWFEHRFSLLFEIFSFYIFSLLHKKSNVVKYCFLLYCLFFFSRKKLFLVCWSSKESNVPLWFLFLLVFLFLKKKLQNKLFLLVFERSFLNHVVFFFVSCFLISFATWFLCKNVFFTSLFPPFIHPLSICSLFLSPIVFSFLSPFSPFYF